MKVSLHFNHHLTHPQGTLPKCYTLITNEFKYLLSKKINSVQRLPRFPDHIIYVDYANKPIASDCFMKKRLPKLSDARSTLSNILVINYFETALFSGQTHAKQVFNLSTAGLNTPRL